MMQETVLILCLLMLTSLYASIECDIEQNLLQRGSKPDAWKWTAKPPDIQRHRRFLPDDTAAWWREMQSRRNQRTALLSSLNNPLNPRGEDIHSSHTNTNPLNPRGEDIYSSHSNPLNPRGEDIHSSHTNTNPLNPRGEDIYSSHSNPLNPRGEDIYFSGRVVHPPFERIEPLPPSTITTTTESPAVHADPDLIRELIIEEHHRPSKAELESASQRLREANDALRGEKTEGGSNDPASFVEYVTPGVELVRPHVEYVSELDAVHELEQLSLRPSVEYVEPFVEYVEPEIRYITKKTNISEKVHISGESTTSELEREFEDYEPIPYEESITIDRKRFLQVHSHSASRRHLVRDVGGEDERRVHRRNPDIGIPEVDYPTLEILPVVHFPCEDYPEPGYYADVTSRCQMFHVCHEDGQRSSFLCPVGTVFNQDYLVCDWWYNVDCSNSWSHGESHETNKLIAASSNIQKDIDNTTLLVKPLPKTTQQRPTYEKSHAYNNDLSSNRLTKLSKKAVNYPLGYAILLREYMKTSPGYLQNRSNVEATTEYIGYNRESGNIDEKKTEGLNLLNPKPRSKIYSRQKQEYFGGSKPYTLSQKTVQERTHIKRVKMRVPEKTLYHQRTSASSALRNQTVLHEESAESLRQPLKNTIKEKITSAYRKTKPDPTNNWYPKKNNLTERYEAMHSIQRFTQIKLNPKPTDLMGNRSNSRLPKRYYLNRKTSIKNGSEGEVKNIFDKTPKYDAFDLVSQKGLNHTEPAVTGEKRDSATDSIKKPIQKKSYLLEPNLQGLSKRFGDRLCSSCISNRPHAIVNQEKFSVSETTMLKRRTIPFIKPIKIYNVAQDQVTSTDHPNPVYFNKEKKALQNDTEQRNLTRNTYQSLLRDIGPKNIPLQQQDENANTEYYYTSKFIKRISNLVSEIKSYSDSLENSMTQNFSFTHPFLMHQRSLKDKNNLTNIRKKDENQIIASNFPINSTSDSRFLLHQNESKIEKLNTASVVANNSNQSLVRTGNGGYVIVKKVKLKPSQFKLEDIKDNANISSYTNVRNYP